MYMRIHGKQFINHGFHQELIAYILFVSKEFSGIRCIQQRNDSFTNCSDVTDPRNDPATVYTMVSYVCVGGGGWGGRG